VSNKADDSTATTSDQSRQALIRGRIEPMRQDNDAANNYTERARQAILGAAQTERDFGGWLAAVLATVAAHLGSSDALTAGRPGSWEADLVQRLVKGTVGWGDEFLGVYAQE
jgi:hypothetical protein